MILARFDEGSESACLTQAWSLLSPGLRGLVFLPFGLGERGVPNDCYCTTTVAVIVGWIEQ